MKIYGNPKTIKGTEKELKSYCCGFCGYKFKQWVGNIPAKENSKRSISDNVKCDNCGNFLKVNIK